MPHIYISCSLTPSSTASHTHACHAMPTPLTMPCQSPCSCSVGPSLSIHGCMPSSMPCLCPRPCLMCPHAFINGCPCQHHGLCLHPLTHALIYTFCYPHHLSLAAHPHPHLVLPMLSIHGCNTHTR